MVLAKEVVFKCPDIRTQMDAISAKEILFSAAGVDDVEVDWKTGLVRVVTVNQDGGADLRERLSRHGFPPQDEDRDYARDSA